MNEAPAEPTDLPDRSTGLTVFGILTILLGSLCAFAALITLFSQAMIKNDPALAGMRGMGYAASFYVGLAVVFVWLGIGSIRARRWARALLVVIFWGWLAMGIVSLVVMAILMPQIMANSPPPGGKVSPGTMTLITVISLGFNAIIFVVIPAIGAYFYSGKSVKATCERRDAVGCWTDRCPLPVLAAGLWMAFGSAALLIMGVSGMAVLPIFGGLVSGPIAIALSVGLAIFWLWAAWAIYRLDIRGWWVALVFPILFAVSSVLTYSRHGLDEVYRLMGYPQSQIDLMQKYAMPDWFMTWGTLIWVLPIVGYLIFIRRHFQKA